MEDLIMAALGDDAVSNLSLGPAGTSIEHSAWRSDATPAGSVELLRWLDASVRAGSNSGGASVPVDSKTADGLPVIMQMSAESNTGPKRLKGLLPAGTIVAHKTGTGGTQKGITGATNDIGIISLPSGKKIAIAVFVSDSPADEKTREAAREKVKEIAKKAQEEADRQAKKRPSLRSASAS